MTFLAHMFVVLLVEAVGDDVDYAETGACHDVDERLVAVLR